MCKEEFDLRKSGKNLYTLKYTYFLWCVNGAFVCLHRGRGGGRGEHCVRLRGL